MRDEHAVLAHALDFFVARMDAMRHDTGMLSPEKAELIVGVAVKRRLRAKLAHPRYLTEILGKMRLHRQIVFVRKCSQSAQQLVGAGRDKARCKNRLRVRKGRSCLTDPALGVLQGSFCVRLAQIIRAVAIHIHLADVADKAAVFQLLHQKFRRRQMHRGKHAHTRRGARSQMIDELPVGTLCVFHVTVL